MQLDEYCYWFYAAALGAERLNVHALRRFVYSKN
jgi:hypothetical protein